jgi:DNA-binding protein Fis
LKKCDVVGSWNVFLVFFCGRRDEDEGEQTSSVHSRFGAMMKQKFLVINCDEHDLDDLRRRIGFDREVVPCPSIDMAARLLPGESSAAVMVSVRGDAAPASTELNGEQPSRDVDSLVARMLEFSNGHDRTLAARVDLLERKIIEQSLNRNGQHRKETAAELGISRVTLYNKMKKFGLLG